MASERSTLTVRILDKEYLVACDEGEQQALAESASYLDKSMKKIRASGKVHGADRIAVMAALNITHEMLNTDKVKTDSGKVAIQLAERIDKVLQELQG